MAPVTNAELSSLSTALDELATRVSSMAEVLSREENDLATELFEVERALAGAQRRLRKVVEGHPA